MQKDLYKQAIDGLQEAAISIKKNRVKHYLNNQVYLNDGQEFEIELFNPSALTRLAKVSINGKSISNAGIVIKPGQRVYLERFIDSPQKFKFDTYLVDKTNNSVATAIANNGDIQVDFYDEYITPTTMYVYTTNSIYPIYNASTTLNYNASNLRGTTTSSSSAHFASTLACDSMFSEEGLTKGKEEKRSKLSLEKETGRVEKGSVSDQKFENYHGSFNTWASKVVRIKINPFSEKPLEAQDLVNYCTNCGTKNKGNKYKFCPTCGSKF